MRVAVIPARGGSKRIRGKNVKDFAGKPIIGYSIECALECGLFDRVVVSTDDDGIAEVAARFGAEVPFRRPDSLSDDHASVMKVMAHALEALKDSGSSISAACCIFATAPFLASADLRRGYEALASGKWNYVIAATSFAYPIFRSFQRNPDGGISMFFPDRFSARSQDLPDALHDAGQFCWGRPDAWARGLPPFDENSTLVTVPRWRVQDIDTAEDWRQAELMYAVLASETVSE